MRNAAVRRLAAFVVFTVPAAAQPGLVNHGTADGASLPISASGINMTGANFLAVCVNASAGVAPTISDSSGNTWVSTYNDSGSTRTTAFYAANASVTSSMTFTLSGSAQYASMEVAGFSGIASGSPYDATAGTQSAHGVATVASAGAITTSQPYDLVVACTGSAGMSTLYPVSINNPFSISDEVVYSAGNYYGGAMGYYVNPSASSVTPSWTYQGGGMQVALQWAFEPHQSSLAVSPLAIAANSGSATLTLTGTGTSWTPGTPGSPSFTLSGLAGASIVSQSVASATSATLVIATGSSTGELTITDPSCSATAVTQVESFSITPATGAVGANTGITFTGQNTAWSDASPSSLFTTSGVSGAILQAVSITSNTSATATLIVPQSSPGTVTITDTSSGATATYAGTSTAPAITGGPSCSANSSSSLLCTWVTGSAGTSQVSCTPSAGGSAISTPVLHPYNYGTGWGVTNHSIAVTGLAPNTAYICTVYTTNASGSTSATAASATTQTPAASIAPAIAYVSPSTRFNDLYNGSNGLPSTGIFLDGDTEYGTWTPTGWLGSCEDCYGVKAANGYQNVQFIQWTNGGPYPLTIPKFFNPTQITSTYVPGSAALLGHWYHIGLASVRGTVYWPMGQYNGSPLCCGTWNLFKTNDTFAHTIAPSSNTGPYSVGAAGFDAPPQVTASITAASISGSTVTLTTALNPPAGAVVKVSGAGCSPGADGDYALTSWTSTQVQYTISGNGSGNCSPSGATITYMRSMAQQVFNPSFGSGLAPMVPIEPCQDYGGANGQYACSWTANMDGWSYWLGLYNSLWRVRIENLPLQRVADWQCFSGAQGSTDVSDASWITAYNAGAGQFSTSCTALTGGPYDMGSSLAYKATISYLPDFNRFIISVYVPVNNHQANPQAGTAIYDLGPYPWGIPKLIGFIGVDKFYTQQTTGFPNTITPTYAKLSSSPLVVNLTWATSGGLFNGSIGTPASDSYSMFFRNVTLVPAVASVGRPQVSSNSRDGHNATGLRLFYDFQDSTGTYSLVNRSPNDLRGAWNYASSYPTVPLLFSPYGLINFGQPTNNNYTDGLSWVGQQSIGMTTPYNEQLGAFTAIVVFGHYPYQVGSTTINPAVSGEVVLNKAGDLSIIRNGSTASWTVSVKGTAIGSVSIADGSFGGIAITRDGSGNVAVYGADAIGSTLPLTPTVTASGVTGAWSSSDLTLGSASQSLNGTLGELLIWNRQLSGAELIQEMNVVRQDMGVRGVTIPRAVTYSMASVTGATNTQAAISYNAPSPNTCTVAVSQSPTMTPLVHDVDPSLFSGSNLDSRVGTVANGPSRTFVVGQRVAMRGSDSNWYSRALQANTLHYYQINCDSTQMNGTFMTANIALGNTYNEDLPSSHGAALSGYYVPGGQYAWPQFLNWNNTTGRSEGVIDPQTGMLLQRVTMPQDQPTANAPAGDHSFTQVYNPSGTWSNAGNILANDSNYASYSGTTSDWLAVTDQNLTNSGGNPIDSVVFSALAWCSGTCSGADANIQVCLTVNGVNCWPSNATANLVSVPLGTAALPSTFATAGSTAPILASWTPAGVNPPVGVNEVVYGDMLQRAGTVNVDGSGNVTWTGGAPFYPNWTTGSRITIAGSLCTISGAVGTGSLAIVPSSCAPSLSLPQTGASYSANNFGFLVRKQTASTDTINLQYAKYTVGAESSINWTSGGEAQVCSTTLTQNTATGDLGYHCILPSAQIYWIDHTTGVGNYLGTTLLPGQSGTNGWHAGSYCNNQSTTLVGTTATAPETMYCTATDLLGNEIILSCAMTSNNTTGNLSFSCSNLTPNTAGADFLTLLANFTADYTPSFSRAVFANGCGISGLQNGNIVMNCVEGGQDTLAWIVVFNPTLVGTAPGCVAGGLPGCVVAAQSTWAVAPCRWCVLHDLEYAGQSNTAWISGKFMGTTPGVGGGGGMISTVISGSLTATPSISAGTGICPSGTAGCDQVTVDGEPCNPSPAAPDTLGCPKNGSWGYLQNAAVGDIFIVQGHNELLYLLNKAGNNWTFQRAYPSGGFSSVPLAYSGTLVLEAYCGAEPPYGSGGWYWNYAADPHGLNSSGTTITTYYYYDHSLARPNFVIGGDGYNGNSADPPGGGYAVLNGSGYGLPNTYEALSPPFAGVRGITSYIEAAQDHPSASQDAAPAEWFNDSRPASSIGSGINGPATLISGQLFKFTSTTTDGDNLTNISGASGLLNGINRKLQATLAFCGTQPLVDISSPATGNLIGTTIANSYQYCIARNAGECRSGSSQGDIYFNCPYAMPLSGSTYGCGSQNDMCVFNTGAYLNAISQVGYSGTDTTGALGRALTKGLKRQRDLDVNENVRVLPDGSWLLFRAVAVNGVEDTVLAGKLPPYPAQDSVVRNTFLPLALNLTPPAGLGATNAIVEFGYMENGEPNQFYCTTRQDTCVAANATIGTTPFLFASEGTGGAESGLTGASCATGCSISIPEISQRIVYYQVKYRNASNQVLAQSGVQVAVTP